MLKRLQTPLRDDVDWNADVPIFNASADEMSGNALMVHNP
jgi:hypothetical protein